MVVIILKQVVTQLSIFQTVMNMKKRIVSTLNAIEQTHNVSILYACESGSRAWGFASQDSDFDVRFIYARKLEWYLSIDLERKPDVIELPITDELDINGWDLRKALQLFRKSNPPLLEWLGSPIVYVDKGSLAPRMRELASESYSPVACMYHYFKMAKRNFREYLRGDRVRLKKYFYVLRPVLAVLYLERGLGSVPTEFSRLLDSVVTDVELRREIDDLLICKMAGQELDDGPRNPVISEFLEQELARMEEQGFEKRVQRCSVEKLDGLFLDVLREP
jgi:predicted nucleotidyltransferase